MGQILLTIAIPTFNRVHLLRQTIEVLLTQLQDGVELLVCDNCSTDGTEAYLRTFKGTLRHHRHLENIGADRNFLSCLTEANGQYVWLLCDDDLPASNAVAEILKARKQGDEPGLIYLRVLSSDERISQYDDAPVVCEWNLLNKNEFLNEIGVWVTFGSSIIVRRDSLEMDFLSRQIGTCLLPASVPLQVAGTTNQVTLSSKPLLFVRGGNSGGYDAFTVFTKNFHDLLMQCQQFGYETSTLKTVFSSSMKVVLPYLTKNWPITARGFLSLCWFGPKHLVFYKNLLPVLVMNALGYLTSFPRRLATRIMRRILCSIISRFGTELYAFGRQLSDASAQKDFRFRAVGLGSNACVHHPTYLKNPKYFQIGQNFFAQPGLRMEAWDSFAGETFCPVIRIGNNVCMNWNVHIGAIDRIEIYDNVLIGSNVLITDHAHGHLDQRDILIPPAQRPLRSKGPVFIEKNVWIGEGVCILPGVRIGHGAIIGANSVITSDIAPNSIVGGVPGRMIRHLASHNDLNCGGST